jgi:hypothetical protein
MEINKITKISRYEKEFSDYLYNTLIPDLLENAGKSKYDFSLTPFFHKHGLSQSAVLYLRSENEDFKLAWDIADDRIKLNKYLTYLK